MTNDRPTTVADFDSRCPACDGPIEAGDKIALNDDEEWCHEDCANE